MSVIELLYYIYVVEISTDRDLKQQKMRRALGMVR